MAGIAPRLACHRQVIPLLFAVFFVLFFTEASQAGWEEGIKAYRNGNYDAAFKELQPLAERGLPEAQNLLAEMYYEGNGVSQDYATAATWYLKSAERGQVSAQAKLATLYMTGLGVPQDYKIALNWYVEAAKKGSISAVISIGGIYADGLGVPQDYSKAIKLYTIAANTGNPIAQFNIANLYKEGLGVPQDFVQAYMWYNLSTAKFALAKFQRDELAAIMTPDQIAEAQRLASAWTAH